MPPPPASHYVSLFGIAWWNCRLILPPFRPVQAIPAGSGLYQQRRFGPANRRGGPSSPNSPDGQTAMDPLGRDTAAIKPCGRLPPSTTDTISHAGRDGCLVDDFFSGGWHRPLRLRSRGSLLSVSSLRSSSFPPTNAPFEGDDRRDWPHMGQRSIWCCYWYQ